MQKTGNISPYGQMAMKTLAAFAAGCVLTVVMLASLAVAAPSLDKTRYHSWDEVNAYLDAVASDPQTGNITELIPIGTTREGRPLKVLRISKEGIPGKAPDTKPATFVMGAHHAREHVSKEAVLGLIDRLINGYGQSSDEGVTITYLVDAGTFYVLPWVNPDGGTNEFLHNPEQRKTNFPTDEPQIGAADCDTCGDGTEDEDSPDIVLTDIGETSRTGRTLAFADNGIITRHLQYWYEDDNYTAHVNDARSNRVQPAGGAWDDPANYLPYAFNYEGDDPDDDGIYAAYSGEDFVGGTDPNRNYGDPYWGDCYGNEGCSWLSGDQTYCGPEPFSEPETSAVAAFMRSHPNIVTMESFHSGINEIYPPWWIYPDDTARTHMDESYHDAVAQYVSDQTGYAVMYGGPYPVKGDTTGYSYIGSHPDLDFFPGGILSMTTEIYGMGSDSGSAEAVKDWFPNHWQEFDTAYPQGTFIAWSDFPWCTTCDPAQMPGPGEIWDYVQYTEYFIFDSNDACGGAGDSDIFHCDYWGIADTDYYADFDIFAYFNPPAANRCYKDWNCDGDALVRTVDKQIRHLLYRVRVAPFIKVNAAESTGNATTLNIAIENTGLLRTSVMTAAKNGEDPFTTRAYDHGRVNVRIENSNGFSMVGSNALEIGWLGGGRSDDPEPRIKQAGFDVTGLDGGDTFTVVAESDKTGEVRADLSVVSCDMPECGNGLCESGEDCFSCPGDCECIGGSKCKKYCEMGSGAGTGCVFAITTTNFTECPGVVDEYFANGGSDCGNGVCETGEDCQTCPGDCVGKTTGPPSQRHCCGNGVCEAPYETEANCGIDCSGPTTAVENTKASIVERSLDQIKKDILIHKDKQKDWKRLEGPFDIVPGKVKGIKLNKYHQR